MQKTGFRIDLDCRASLLLTDLPALLRLPEMLRISKQADKALQAGAVNSGTMGQVKVD